MNKKLKRRMIAVSGVIIIVVILLLAIVGGNTSAKSINVSQAASADYNGQKVQVSGNVVPASYSTQGNVLYFRIYDADNPDAQLSVEYEGAASSTFGNDVTAICTGRINNDGVLQCSELVTKCPSKYESSTDALTVSRLLGYGSNMEGAMVKVAGTVQSGSLKPAGEGTRFVLVDEDGTNTMNILYDGALPNEVADGSSVVLTGSMTGDGNFAATDVALQG